MNIFGKRDRYARNNFSKEHYQTYKYVRERVKKGKSEYKLSKKIHRLTKDLYDSQPTEQNRLLTNVAYDARKDAKTTRKKYKGSVKKIFNKYSETDFDLKGGLTQSGVNMGETINGVYIPSQDDLLLHYGKKGMKWKKKGEGAIGIGTVGAAPAFQDKALERRATIERLIAKEHEKARKNSTDSKKAKIRADLRDKANKNAKELEKKRENMYNPYRGDKLPKKKVNHSDTSEDTLLHYGKKGMKWKKLRAQLNEGEEQGVGVIGGATVGIGQALNVDYLMKKRYEEIDKRDKFNAAAKATNRKQDKKKI